MKYLENVESMIKDYEKMPYLGNGVWEKVMGPLLNNYFDGKYNAEEMVEITARLARGIALEYGRDDLLKPFSTNLEEGYSKMVDKIAEKMVVDLGPEGKRAITLFDLFILTLAGLIREVVSAGGSAEKRDLFVELPYEIEGATRYLKVSRGTFVQGLMETEGLTGETVDGIEMVWENGTRKSEKEVLRVAIESMKIMAKDISWHEPWMNEIGHSVFYIGNNFKGMRAMKMASETDPGLVLISRGFLDEETAMEDILMTMAHELDHLAFFRWLLQNNEKLICGVLMEMSANEAGLRFGRAIGAGKDSIERYDEDSQPYRKLAVGDSAAIFSTFEWSFTQDWFKQPGMANDWRRIAKVMEQMVTE